jgi:Ca2+/H+ antiporter
LYRYTKEEEDDDEDGSDDEGEPPTKMQIIRKSAFLLTVGMLLIALFADPMVSAVTSLSTAMGRVVCSFE